MEKKDKKAGPDDTRLRWKKLHGGTHYHSDGQVVKRGEVLKAHVDEMSKVVQAGFECLDTIDPAMGDKGIRLQVQMVSPGRYDIINPVTGKAINSAPISKKAAESFGSIDGDLED